MSELLLENLRFEEPRSDKEYRSLLICDYDGIIVKDRWPEAVLSYYRDILRVQLDPGEWLEKYLQNFRNIPPKDLPGSPEGFPWEDPDTIIAKASDIEQYHRDNYPEEVINLFMFKLLKSSRVALAITTNRSFAGVADSLRNHHLEEVFETVLAADSFRERSPKPNPAMVRAVMDHYVKCRKISPARVFAIGDRGSDIEAFKKAGIVDANIFAYSQEPFRELEGRETLRKMEAVVGLVLSG